MLRPSNWLHEISLHKRADHHFLCGLIPLEKNTLPVPCCGIFYFKTNNCPVFETFQVQRIPSSEYIKTLKESRGFIMGIFFSLCVSIKDN
jgi:hypothetical protein